MRPTVRVHLHRASGVLLAASLIVALAVLPGQLSRSSAAQVTGPTVTATPTRVTDGQSVTVNIRTSADRTIIRAEVRLCRTGVAYATSTGLRPAPDAAGGGPNCSPNPVSSSSDTVVVNSNISETAATDEGESFLFRVGSGVVNWADTDSVPRTMTCDQSSPCALVVELRIQEPEGAIWRPFVTPVTYLADDPFAGCGGPAEGALATGGSDRMTDTWINWTIGECTLEGRTGAAGRASFVGEGNAVSQFSQGLLDLAYTGAGFNEEVAFLEVPEGTAPRPAVAVPTALNATVLAVAGGVRTAGHKTPFKDIKLTAEEVAVLLGQGAEPLRPYLGEIYVRNPQLAEAGFFDISAGFQSGAYADAEISSWYMTRYLASVAPAPAWHVPDTPLFGDDRGEPRGIHANLALADPSFNNALTLLTGRPSVTRGLSNVGPSSSGGAWLLTDLATARALGLTVVQIENASGAFVAPTEASMLAAVSQMDADAHGILISDPTVVAPAGEVQPYPLTFVEYALAPAHPLSNADCSARASSQALLGGWLEFITGPGQAELPAGMLPLPTALADQAATRVDLVGKTPRTGSCPPPSTTPPTPLPPTVTPIAPPSLVPSVVLPTFTPSALDLPATETPGGTAGAAHGDSGNEPVVTVPAFVARQASGPTSTLFALVGIIALTSLATVLTAGAAPARDEQG